MKVELFTNDLPVVDFTLDLKNRTITNMHIVNSLMANIYLGNLSILKNTDFIPHINVI